MLLQEQADLSLPCMTNIICPNTYSEHKHIKRFLKNYRKKKGRNHFGLNFCKTKALYTGWSVQPVYRALVLQWRGMALYG